MTYERIVGTMPKHNYLGLVMTLAVYGALIGQTIKASAQGIDDPFELIKSYDFQTRTPVDTIYKLIQASISDKAVTAKIEEKLDAVLQDSAATFAGKQEVCRMLWIIGSAKSVPILAKMLTDEKLSDIARYALERNADAAAGAALRAALLSTSGKTQIGIVNSVGDRGDAQAVAALKPFVMNADAHLSEASITALGKIGTPAALAVLRALPKDNALAGHAMLRAASRMTSAPKNTEAAHIYEELTAEGRPAVVRVEAIRGLAAIQSPRASAISLAALKSTDPYIQQVGARVAGSLADKLTTNRCLVLWSTLPIPVQIVLLTALADRHEAAAITLALTAADSKDAELRLTGIRCAARIGGAKAVARLVDMAVHGDGQDRNVARESLAGMSGAEADQTILQLAVQGKQDARLVLMGVLAERLTPAAMAALLDAARGTDARLAVAALRALNRVGGPAEHGQLIKLLVSTKSDDVRDAAKDAIIAIGQRMGDKDRAAEPVLAALPGASQAGRAALIPILAETGGDKALTELTNAAASSDPDVKQAAVSALADGWQDSRPLVTLMKIAKSDTSKALRVQALRGSLRIIGQDDKMSADVKVANIFEALRTTERPEENKLALSILRDVRIESSMTLAASLLTDTNLFNEAADTVLYLAAPQRKNNRMQSAVTGAATNSALDKIIQLTKDDNQRALAQKLKG